ncbi:acetyl-CoA C-acyltransferase [Kocuria sp.]|uniref:acetyl-CoA C-acyltransferase n=1 Tax=Kocuria sp. TaxID=1871328 RepID=UPI0025C66B3F|nr:acetyl-CoA C-acyltransferase [Kocuria sp.]
MSRHHTPGGDDAVIVATRRTPIGRAGKGSLVGERPEDLAVSVIDAVLDSLPQLTTGELEDLYLGCAVPDGVQNQNIARRVAVLHGLDALPAVTVNRFCASSLQAARMAAHAVRAGEGEAFLVGGVESVSHQQPADLFRHSAFDDAAARVDRVFAEGLAWQDPRSTGSLPDVYVAMGVTAELVARLTCTTRQDQDEWACHSQRRAAEAASAGFFAREIAPYRRSDGTVIVHDDGIRPDTTLEVLASLRPAFHPEGTATAGNSSPLNDGASAAVIMSAARAAQLGIQPLARIVSTAATALSPEIMGLGPVSATRRALERAQMTIDDIDIIELNEAFAAQVVPTVRQLEADPERVNPFGGAIALGHPFGSTGVRLLTTLINGLQWKDGNVGVATLCVGGGQGMAMVIERMA